MPSLPSVLLTSRPCAGRRAESSAEATCAECGTDLRPGEGEAEGRASSSERENSSTVEDSASEEDGRISLPDCNDQTETSSLHMKVIDAFWRCFRSDQDDLALAAVHALGAVVRSSRATSVLQLFVHIRAASDALEAYARREDVLRYIGQLTSVKRLTTLPLRSACLLYQQFGLKHHERRPDISLEELRELLVAQSAKFASRILHSKQTIADIGKIMFTRDESVILTHGRSSCVEMLLKNAWRKHQKRFSVIVTHQEEKLGDFITDDVDVLTRSLAEAGIPTVETPVGSVGRLMASVDFVVVGTEAVAENGGIINRVGTSTVAMVARQHCVPFYVACEACKFTRTHFLQQEDASKFSMFRRTKLDSLDAQMPFPSHYYEYLDYTQPELISLLFTDLGVFAPRNVSEELAKLYESC